MIAVLVKFLAVTSLVRLDCLPTLAVEFADLHEHHMLQGTGQTSLYLSKQIVFLGV